MGKATKANAKKSPKKAPASAAKEPAGGQGMIPRRLPLVLLFAGLILVVLIGWGNWLWTHIGPVLKSSEEYRLDPNSIEVQPKPPAWIRGDVRSEVIRGIKLDDHLSMLDEKLPQRIADAFEFHPWVASAKVTLQYPARVQVELTYRQPVAQLMIENRAGDEQVVLDSTGVRLPETDLTVKEIARLPSITEIVGAHLPLVGQRVEDTRMRGAVEIAALLTEEWFELRLEKIIPLVELQGEQRARYQAYQLQGADGCNYFWGAAPSESPSEETSSATKIARLRSSLKHSQEHQPGTSQVIDLRHSLPDEAAQK
jgi:hypothetical protein